MCMTPKTKVLKHLDQYRDKSLTMGCEVTGKHHQFLTHLQSGKTIEDSLEAIK